LPVVIPAVSLSEATGKYSDMKNNLLSENLLYMGQSPTPTKLYLYTYNPEGMMEKSAQNFSVIRTHLKSEGVNWLQIRGLQDTEVIREVCDNFNVDFLVIQDILTANQPTKIEEHDTYTVVITKLFYLPELDDDEVEQQQLCLILGNNFVLTFLEQADDFFSDVTAALRKNILKIWNRQPDYLFSVLLNSVMADYTILVTNIDDALEDLEEELLTIHNNRDIGIRIQRLRRHYMTIKRSILPLKEQYGKLFRLSNGTIYKVTRPFYNDVNDHLQLILQTIEICRETLSSLVDLYISNNDLRRNDIMKRLTVVSTIFIPLTFLAGVWGMNFDNMPELNWKYGYIFAWITMVTTAFIVSLYFRKKSGTDPCPEVIRRWENIDIYLNNLSPDEIDQRTVPYRHRSFQ